MSSEQTPSAKTVNVKATCNCGTNAFQIQFNEAEIPYHSALCHCNACRHVTGRMGFFHVPISSPPTVGRGEGRKIGDKDLNMYWVSESSVRYFCGRCGAQMFMREKNSDSESWFVSGGCLEREDLAPITSHINLEETLDGGISEQLVSVEGKTLPRYSKEVGSTELPPHWRSQKLPPREESLEADRLHFYCHCRTNEFYITRPNQDSLEPQAPYPDLLFPRAQTRLATVANKKDVKWWLDPVEGAAQKSHSSFVKRYLAGHCVCDFCTKGSAFEIQSWAYVSRNNVRERETDEIITFHSQPLRPRGLKQYISSAGRYREFCSTCGATIFWWNAGRPGLMIISMGLVDQDQDGVRAEEWFRWVTNRVSYLETPLANATRKKILVKSLVEGLSQFSQPV